MKNTNQELEKVRAKNSALRLKIFDGKKAELYMDGNAVVYIRRKSEMDAEYIAPKLDVRLMPSGMYMTLDSVGLLG